MFAVTAHKIASAPELLSVLPAATSVAVDTAAACASTIPVAIAAANTPLWPIQTRRPVDIMTNQQREKQHRPNTEGSASRQVSSLCW